MPVTKLNSSSYLLALSVIQQTFGSCSGVAYSRVRPNQTKRLTWRVFQRSWFCWRRRLLLIALAVTWHHAAPFIIFFFNFFFFWILCANTWNNTCARAFVRASSVCKQKRKKCRLENMNHLEILRWVRILPGHLSHHHRCHSERDSVHIR